jgi:hypothetical protein
VSVLADLVTMTGSSIKLQGNQMSEQTTPGSAGEDDRGRRQIEAPDATAAVRVSVERASGRSKPSRLSQRVCLWVDPDRYARFRTQCRADGHQFPARVIDQLMASYLDDTA